MVSRREIERMILVALGQLQTLEENLDRRFRALASAPREAQTALHLSLRELQSRAVRLERLMDALDQLDTNTVSNAA